MNKKILILLGFSLALNFAFIGFYIARPCSVPLERPQVMPAGKHRPQFGFMKQAFKAHEHEMRQAHQHVMEALKTEPADPQRIKAALAEADQIRHQIDEQVQDLMLERFMQMPPEERAEFIKRFEFKGKFGKSGSGKHGPRGPGADHGFMPPAPPMPPAPLPPPAPEEMD